MKRALIDGRGVDGDLAVAAHPTGPFAPGLPGVAAPGWPVRTGTPGGRLPAPFAPRLLGMAASPLPVRTGAPGGRLPAPFAPRLLGVAASPLPVRTGAPGGRLPAPFAPGLPGGGGSRLARSHRDSRGSIRDDQGSAGVT